MVALISAAVAIGVLAHLINSQPSCETALTSFAVVCDMLLTCLWLQLCLYSHRRTLLSQILAEWFNVTHSPNNISQNDNVSVTVSNDAPVQALAFCFWCVIYSCVATLLCKQANIRKRGCAMSAEKCVLRRRCSLGALSCACPAAASWCKTLRQGRRCSSAGTGCKTRQKGCKCSSTCSRAVLRCRPSLIRRSA